MKLPRIIGSSDSSSPCAKEEEDDNSASSNEEWTSSLVSNASDHTESKSKKQTSRKIG
jgi:hypothetical protein